MSRIWDALKQIYVGIKVPRFYVRLYYSSCHQIVKVTAKSHDVATAEHRRV
jgi:hypothetical protein